ncbi:hypothetical protein [Alicyclobacillus macrosporangiidus]|uniref:hypothetical protein n=1 Tax=Alicyclobacillus macrosporangiidus TaxID=392015 RepID=UPI000496EC59|nr:hypothetical protein [Alicyclobacillus macrosporangiidus]
MNLTQGHLTVLTQEIEQWYAWLIRKITDSDYPDVRAKSSDYVNRVRRTAYQTLDDTDWFIQTGSQALYQEKNGQLAGRGGAMEMACRPNFRQTLCSAIEKWYAWLISNPNPLFNSDDMVRMQAPVVYFHQTTEWLSRTTILNTDWFFDKGSQVVMNRWRKEDYDAYE